MIFGGPTGRSFAERGHTTDEEQEDLLQLLANYENMARGVESLIHYSGPSLPSTWTRAATRDPSRTSSSSFQSGEATLPRFGVKFMLDRRAVPRD